MCLGFEKGIGILLRTEDNAERWFWRNRKTTRPYFILAFIFYRDEITSKRKFSKPFVEITIVFEAADF